jgi:hypothetical protein
MFLSRGLLLLTLIGKPGHLNENRGDSNENSPHLKENRGDLNENSLHLNERQTIFRLPAISPLYKSGGKNEAVKKASRKSLFNDLMRWPSFGDFTLP